jgi:hypothetical protein
METELDDSQIKQRVIRAHSVETEDDEEQEF